MFYRCPIKQEISSYIISKCAHSLIYNHRISFSITDHCFLFNDFQLITNPSFFLLFLYIYTLYIHWVFFYFLRFFCTFMERLVIVHSHTKNWIYQWCHNWIKKSLYPRCTIQPSDQDQNNSTMAINRWINK